MQCHARPIHIQNRLTPESLEIKDVMRGHHLCYD